MNIHEKYLFRCLQLANMGKRSVSPNPMVGSVIVYKEKIIGEGFHPQYGEAHAEVNAVNSVHNKELLKESTLYVSLEPCSHYGKTPSCAKLIIESGIRNVIIACTDPFPQVAGTGIKTLKEAGVTVTVGILENEAKSLNKHFFTRQLQHRPYIYLKWAQSSDKYIDRTRKDSEPKIPTPISNSFTKMLVHKKRAEVSAIMIGTNTAVNDNPSLTTRLWYGNNPIRIVLDRQGRIPVNNHIFDEPAQTIVFSEKQEKSCFKNNVKLIHLPFDNNLLSNILSELNLLEIDSLLVEGGSSLLNSFISQNLWDEAYIETANIKFHSGVKAPIIEGEIVADQERYGTHILHLNNYENHKFL